MKLMNIMMFALRATEIFGPRPRSNSSTPSSSEYHMHSVADVLAASAIHPLSHNLSSQSLHWFLNALPPLPPLPHYPRTEFFLKNGTRIDTQNAASQLTDFSQTEIFRILGKEDFSHLERASTLSNSMAKGSSARFSRSLDDDLPVPASKQLISTPSSFLSQFALKVETQIGVQPWPREGGYARLVASENQGRTQYYLQHSTSAEGDSVAAYFLPNNYFLPKNQPSYLDLPKNPEIGCLVVIGDLGRDSIVISEVPDTHDPSSPGLRLLRDAREYSAVLHKNIRLSIDVNQYAQSGFQTSAMMVYEKEPSLDATDVAQSSTSTGHWKLYVQRRSEQTGALEPLSFRTKKVIQDTKVQQFFKTNLRNKMLSDLMQLRRQLGLHSWSPLNYLSTLVSKISTKAGLVFISQDIRDEITRRQYDLYLKKEKLTRLSQLNSAQEQKLSRIMLQLSDLYMKHACLDELSDYWRIVDILKNPPEAAPALGDDGGVSLPSGEHLPEEAFMREGETLYVSYPKLEAYLLSLYDPDLAEGMRHPENVILPRSFNKDGDLVQMKRVLLREIKKGTQLSSTQKGAMLHYIGEAASRDHVQNLASSVGDFIDRASQLANKGVTGYALAQDFFLHQVGDKYDGRCYPLSLMVAAGFSKGETYLNNFIEKVKQAQQTPNTEDTSLLIRSLDLLHSDSIGDPGQGIFMPALVDVKNNYIEKHVEIMDIVAVLYMAKMSESFVLSTKTHSMTLGVRLEEEGKKYFFYDPNFAILVFNSLEDFTAVLTNHFFTHHYAEEYDAQDGLFRLEKIDAQALSSVQIMPDLSLNDLFEKRSLSAARAAPINAFFDTSNQWLSLPQVKKHLLQIDAHRKANDLRQAFRRLLNQAERDAWIPFANNLESTWLPVFNEIQIKTHNDESIYRIHLLQLGNEDTQENLHWIETRDKNFFEFKEFANALIKQFSQAYSLKNERFQVKPNLSYEEATNGLNSMAAIQAIFQEVNRQDAQVVQNINQSSVKLTKALEAHTYWNWLQIADGGRQDVGNVIHLLHNLVLSGSANRVSGVSLPIAKAMNSFSRALNLAASPLLQAGSIIFDAYELTYAQNQQQRALFGTQLSFDTASFLMSVASTTSGMIGSSSTAAVASTAIEMSSTVGSGTSIATDVSGGVGLIGEGGLAEILGSLAVPVAGLGIGFTALAKSYGQITDEVQAVGRYFQNLKTAYINGGYQYNPEHKIWLPLAGAVIKTLDLQKNKVEFDSQYIYRTHHGQTGSGAQNYFFWAGDFPRIVKDNAQALNIRQLGLEQTDNISYPQAPNGEKVWQYDGQESVIILPNTPKSYITYKYESLPGATSLGGEGLDILRRLERGNQFDFDFYIFPSEYAIRTLYQDYVRTSVDIILDENRWRIQMPSFPPGLENKMHYELYAVAGKSYVIGLNRGASLALHTPDTHLDLPSDDNSPVVTHWVLDMSALNNNVIKIRENSLKIGGIDIYLYGSGARQITLIQANGEITNIDTTRQTLRIISEDAAQWHQQSQTLETHLQQMAEQHPLTIGQFIAIDHYQVEGKNIGRAYYDTAAKKMIYIADNLKGQPSLSATLELATVKNNHAYFYDTHTNFFAKIDAANGRLLTQYSRSGDFSNGKLTRVWQEGEKIFSAWQHTMRRHGDRQDTMQFIYEVTEETSLLTSITGYTKLLDILGQRSHIDKEAHYIYAIRGLLFLRSSSSTRPTDSRTGATAELLVVSGKNRLGVMCRYWVRKHDGFIIKPKLPILSQAQLSTLRPNELSNRKNIPADLLLCASFPLNDDASLTAGHRTSEIFYFYSPQEKILYRQVEAGRERTTISQLAEKIEIPGLRNVVNISGALLAINDTGLIYKVNVDGTLELLAVNRTWLKNHPQWCDDLRQLVKATAAISPNTFSHSLNIFGLEDSTGKTLPAWVQDNHIVIGQSHLNGQKLQFVGLMPNDQALLFDDQRGALMQQPLLGIDILRGALNSDGKLKPEIEIPPTTLILSNVQQIFLTEHNEVRLTTKDGLDLKAPLELLLQTPTAFTDNVPFVFEQALVAEGAMAEEKIAPERPTLLGVTAAWQIKQQANLVTAFTTLDQQYQHAEAICLEKTPVANHVQTPSWYHFPSKQIIVAYGVSRNEQPILLDVKGSEAFCYKPKTGEILLIQQPHLQSTETVLGGTHFTTEASILGSFAHIERAHTNLFLQGKNQGDPYRINPSAIPIIPSATSLILQPGAGNNTYLITQAAWEHYAVMIVDKPKKIHAYDTSEIILDIAHSNQVIVNEADTHVLIYDPTTQKSLIMREVLSEVSPSGKWNITTNTLQWQIGVHSPRLSTVLPSDLESQLDINLSDSLII